MSLLRQLWITVIVASLIAWLAGFAVSIYTARSYLEQQLHAQGAETATAIAMCWADWSLNATMERLPARRLGGSCVQSRLMRGRALRWSIRAGPRPVA